MNREIRLTSHERRATSDKRVGSALILAVVLTSLLAIIGVTFILLARVDKISTSAISENKELNLAVDTVIADISRDLVLDVPAPGRAGWVYYDYPDANNNPWLASLEPYQSKTDPNKYYWRHISDVTEYLRSKVFSVQNVDVKPVGLSTTTYVREYPIIRVASDGTFLDDANGNPATNGVSADADGDGIADSKWIQLDSTSNKGKHIYAAVRIIDNGGMLNVNTGYKFDPNVGPANANLIDGSSQTQINLLALANRPFYALTPANIQARADYLNNYRCGTGPNDITSYASNVVWKYDQPVSPYTPFDISDELELRYRFLVNQEDIDTRAEVLPLWELRTRSNFRSPADSGQLDKWFINASPDTVFDVNYAYRHIATTYNMDRIIDPNGNKMLNINQVTSDNVNPLYQAVKAGLREGGVSEADSNSMAAQIAVNLIDYRDSDSNVTSFPCDGKTYYGFERPCIYISEVAQRFRKLGESGPFSYIYRRSYAIELYKPYYPEDSYPELNQWRLNIQGYGTVDVNWSGTRHFHVVCLDDPCDPISPSVHFDLSDKDPNFNPSVKIITPIAPNTRVTSVSLQRKVGTDWISVDSTPVPLPSWLVPLPPNEGTRSFKRDITLHKCIRRLWDISGTMMDSNSLGQRDPNYLDSSATMIQAHPYLDPLIYENKGFKNIGEIGMVFRKNAGDINSLDTEATVRLNLADTRFQQVFKYLTVFDPNIINTNEMRIKGRININTAPWYVIAQLPWVSQRKGGYDSNDLAMAIVEYRDSDTVKGFKSIGGLMNVPGMNYYAKDNKDANDFPDLTPNDGAKDDFEERDVIFARISNLVTVRSDVFTAYILVRIGTDGPQKRVIAILDRSNVRTAGDKVKIIALYPVPDPR